MTTDGFVFSPQMAPHLDRATRERIAANLRFLRKLHDFPTVAAMAKKMGVSRSALNRYLRGERTVGLDVLLMAKASFGASLDWFVMNIPPAQYFEPYDGDE